MHVCTMRLPADKVTVRQAMKITGYCRIMIYNLIRNQKIKGTKIKFGEVILHVIDRDSLLEYCRQQERPVNEQA